MNEPAHRPEVETKDPWDDVFTRANVIPALIQMVVAYAFTLGAWIQAVLQHNIMGAAIFFGAGAAILLWMYNRNQRNQDPPVKTLTMSSILLGFMLAKFTGFYMYLTQVGVPWF
ncbi:MAG: hypothetical protein OEV94_02745 [Deltaproteobacteria bacterium]|nr:hypothetical protein [Deltaproteobacteria bacterium]